MAIDFNLIVKYCSWLTKLFIGLIISLASCSFVNAQEMVIFFQLRPPFDQPLEEYKDQLAINLTNPTDHDVSGFLQISIFNSDRSVEIVSTLAGRKSVTLESGVTTLTDSDLDDLIAINRLSFIGVNADDVFFTTGLPAGRYYLCLELYNEQSRQISNTACTNFQVNVPVVAGSLLFLPPYNIPFGEYNEQVTLSFMSSASLTGTLELSVSGFNNNIVIRKQSSINLEQGANILSGPDIEYYFSPGGFTTINGISENQLFETGLAAGDYLMTFTLLLEGIPIAVANRPFTVPVIGILLSTRTAPPFDVPLEDLFSQTTVTIQSSRSISDAYLTMTITGDHVLIESNPAAIIDRIQLQANIPEMIMPGDVINLTGTGVQFQGISQVDGITHGLPPGNYSYCFRLWDNNGQLLTEQPACFSLNVPQTFLTMSVQALPPFITQVEDVYNMLRVNVNASRDMGIGFYARITGDNGISIINSTRNIQDIIELEKNVPQLLDGGDLSPYFDLNQTTLSGTTFDKIQRSGLPQGHYQVCLTPYVVEGYPPADVREVCSNPFPVNYIEPPQLLTPECGQVHDISKGQFIIFNWLPSPGAPPDTEYTLKIVEMRFPGQNPMDALLTSTAPVFFEEQIIGTSYLYGPGEPLLEPGYQYAYQVYLGDEPQRGNYVNAGMSQACTFTVVDPTILVDDTIQTITPKNNVVVKPLEENPFDGFNFPVTKVTGTLNYKFKSFDIKRKTNNQNTIIQGSNQATQNSGPSIGPQFNHDNIPVEGSLPLANVHVKLQEGYLLFGSQNGQDVSGQFINDPFTNTVKTIAATTTDSNGNFEFTYMLIDTLGKGITLTPMETQISLSNVSGKIYKVYRLVVESPYYCSPDMNIVVQPWQEIDLGTLVSYVKSYNLKVVTIASVPESSGNPFENYLAAYMKDQAVILGTPLSNITTQIQRKKNIAGIPQNEGQNLNAGDAISEDATNAEGTVMFSNLVRHYNGNPNDQYTISCSTENAMSLTSYDGKPQLYPVFGSFSNNPFSYPLPVIFNSDFVIETFTDTVRMMPDPPKVRGQVKGIQPPAELSALPKRKTGGELTLTTSLSTINGVAQNNSSATLESSELFQSGLSVNQFQDIYANDPNWGDPTNASPLSGVVVELWEYPIGSRQSNVLTTVTDENGLFQFTSLDLQYETKTVNGVAEISVIGPNRKLKVNHPGYKPNETESFKLKWGGQYVKPILLEPDGFVFGYVEDENGKPLKAEVFIGDFTSTKTIQSQVYQNLLGLSGPLRELFILKAPSGSQLPLHIVPEDPVFVPTEFDVTISENSGPVPQNLGAFKVGTYKHRILLQITEKGKVVGNPIQGKSTMSYPPVKNALVRVTNLINPGPSTNNKTSQGQPGISLVEQDMTIVNTGVSTENTFGYANDNGFVELIFSNNGQTFTLEIIPPADKDLVSKTIVIQSEPSGKLVHHGKRELEEAWKVSGKVTYGSDSLPLGNARVYINDMLEIKTHTNGTYTLNHIPKTASQYVLTAENIDNPLTLVAQKKTIQFPMRGNVNVNFHLETFDAFEIKELMGIPVTVTSITPNGAHYSLDGAFIKLPGNPNFSLKDQETQLKFKNIPITSTQQQGKQVAVPVNTIITLDESQLDLVNYTKLLVKQTPSSGAFLQVTADNTGKGFINGKVSLQNSSFQFDQHYASFNEETSAPTGQGGVSLVLQTPVIATDKLKRSYIDLFSYQSDFRYFNNQTNSGVISTLTPADYPLRTFHVADQNLNDYEFTVQEFKAIAKKNASYVYKDTLVLSTTLLVDNIPLSVPKSLQVDVGTIRVSTTGFEEIIGKEPIQFNIEQWKVTCTNWSLNPNISGIIAKAGVIDMGVFQTTIKDITIKPNDLDLGSIDLSTFNMGGVVPITLEANTFTFGINGASGSDLQPHWEFSIVGFNGQPGASLQNLPGMKAGDKIPFQEITLLSNGDKTINMGNQNVTLEFYNIVKVTPDLFSVTNAGLEMRAMLDLEIPGIQSSAANFVYYKSGGVVQSLFKGMEVRGILPGNISHLESFQVSAQKLEMNRFETLGSITHEEVFRLKTRLVKSLDSTYLEVHPLGQTLKIADDGSNYMAKVTGGTKVNASKNWNLFAFSGDLEGMKGVEDSKKRKTFVVGGAINATNQELDVKNISSGFGGMTVHYDFHNNRLTGHLKFDQEFSSVRIAAQADFLTDRDGWYFLANGEVETPGFGVLKAGLGIGDYDDMRPEITDILLSNAYNKNLPPAFQSGFSGFFFTGLKNIPQLSVPKTEFDFLFLSGSLEITVGFDARLWMGFEDNGTEFGIGVMAFAFLELLVSSGLSCTELYGYLGAELGVTGMYNTGTGTFTLMGCGSLTVAGAANQCSFPPACTDPCLSGCDSIGVRVDMMFDSDGKVDAGFSLGSCGGGEPLNQEIKDKFNCN